MKKGKIIGILKRGRIFVTLRIVIESFLFALIPLSISTFLIPLSPKFGIVFMILTPLVFLGWFFLKAPYELKWLNVARRLENRHPFIEERLLSLLELEKEFHENREGYSPFFLERLEREVENLSTRIKTSRLFSPSIWALRSLPLALLIALTGYLLHPTKTIKWITGFEENVLLIPKPLKITTITLKPETLYVEALGIQSPPILVGNGVRKITEPFTEDLYKAEVRFSQVGKYQFLFQHDGTKSNVVRVNVLERPSMDSLRVILQYPPYTGWKSETLSEKVLSVLEGSRITLQAFFDADSLKILSGKERSFVEESSPALYQDLAKKDKEVTFVLYRGGKEVRSGEKVTFLVIPDTPPTIKFISPYGEIPLPEDMSVNITGLAEDDIGLKEIKIIREFNKKIDSKKIRSFRKLTLLDTFSFTINLDDLPILPGDEVKLTLVAIDSKGQKTKSEPLIVRLPTPEELYEATQEATSAGEGKAESLHKKAEELSEKLKKVEELLKENRNVNWSQREKLKEVVKAEKELLKEIENQLSEVSNVLGNIEKTYSFSPDLVEKIREVQRLFEEVMTEEMRQALKKLEEAMQKLTPQEIQKALTEMKIDQEALKRNLERLAEILKRFKQEAELRRLAEFAKELERREKELNQKITSTSSQDSLSQLSKEQESIEKDLESLSKDLKKLSNELQKSDKAIADSISSLNKEDIPPTQSEMNKASKSLMKGKKSQASGACKSASRRLSKIAKKLSSLSQQLQSSRLQNLAANLSKLRREVIFLSLIQEDIVDKIEGLENPDTLAHIEEGVREGTDRVTKDLVKVIQMSLLMNPRMAAYLSEASHSAMRAQEALSSRNPQLAKKEATQALNFLNLAALSMLQAEKKCKGGGSCSSSTGLEQALQQLAQMAQQQASLNSQTQGLIPLPTPIPRQQLAQIAAQQKAIGEALKRLTESLGKEGGLLSALEKASKEAEEVAKKIEKGEINKELLKRQERILAKMLEVQKSIHKQEFSRIRKSTPGRTFKPVPPGELEIAKRRERIRRGLLQLQNLSFPQGYKALIRAYFESLLKE